MTWIDIAIVVLVDRAGRILMQHRDDRAPINPGLWTPPGGRVEPGEDVLSAAHRELREETGLAAQLTPLGTVDDTRADGSAVRFHVFTGTTDAAQTDVVLGEGQAMLFLTPDEIAGLPLSHNAQRCLDLLVP